MLDEKLDKLMTMVASNFYRKCFSVKCNFVKFNNLLICELVVGILFKDLDVNLCQP